MNTLSIILQGKKTYIGLALTLYGVLGISEYITPQETANVLNKIFELIGIAIAVYGRYSAKLD